jgi:hypothetical protein
MFAPVDFAGYRRAPSLTAEWFVLPVRDWRDLEGRVVEGEQETIETSFYVFEHDRASWTRLAFGRRDRDTLVVTVDAEVQLLGLDAEWTGPSHQDASIHAHIALPYRGLSIDRNDLEGRPENRAAALTIAARYVDLYCY